MLLKPDEQDAKSKVLEEIMELMDQLEAKPLAPKSASPDLAMLSVKAEPSDDALKSGESATEDKDELDPEMLQELLKNYGSLK